MEALTREAIREILPVLQKDGKAKRALASVAGDKGKSLSTIATEVRKHAARIFDDGMPGLTNPEKTRLMMFLSTYGRPGNAAKTGEARTVPVNILFTPTERALLTDAAKMNHTLPATYVYEAAIARLKQDLGLEDGI